MDQAILEREARKLPAHERALLADALLGSLDDESMHKAGKACAREAEDRHEAYVRGEVEATKGPPIFQKLRQKHAK